MKHSLIVGAFALAAGTQAFAADLPPMAAPAPRAPAAYIPAPPVFTWTGIYIGVNAGAAWVNQGAPTTISLVTLLPQPSVSTSSIGFAGGLQIGGNYQFNQLVLGLEADADYLSNKSTVTGTTSFTPPGGVLIPGTESHAYKLDYLSTVRGRIGYAFDRTLLYGTGGLAMGGYSVTRTQTSGTLNNATAGTAETYSDTRFGWTAGAGLEYAFTDDWTAKIEYLYADLKSVSYTFPLAARAITTPTESVNLVRAGLNYKF